MKKALLLMALGLVPLTLVGSNGLTWSCVDGTMDSGNCVPGRVAFTGSWYPSSVHVNVTQNSTNTVQDDFDYDAAGTLTFTETLLRGSYTVTITGNNSVITQSVTVGSWDDGN